MRSKNTQPKPGRFLTLKRKAEELDSHSEGDVLGSPELKKQKVHGNAGEEVDDLESWADELEDLILESTVFEESSQPIDFSQQSLLDEIDELEVEDRKLNEKINSTEGPESTDQIDSPLDITEEFWKNPLVACFDEGETMLRDPIWPWEACEYQNNHCPGFPSGIGTSTTWDLGTDIFSIMGQSDVEREMMRMTMLEEHLRDATGTFGCTSTPFPCESGKGQTDPIGFEAEFTSNLHDQQFMVDPHSFTEVLQIDSLGPRQYELHENHELIIID
ncbi:hypothetical protein ACLB2K_063980 [Fragaria x ananassa]